MTSPQTADSIWEAAGEYAVLTMEHLTLCKSRKDEELKEEHQWLRIHFVFPKANEFERFLLMQIRRCRDALNLRVATLRRQVEGGKSSPHLTAEQRATIEAGATRGESEFVELRKSILQSSFVNSLTIIQRQILDAHFLTIPFIASM